MSDSDAIPFPRSAPAVPPGCCVYAVGDIHGRLDLLEQLLGQIAADVEKRQPQQVSLVFLGDVIDRGPDSRGVVARLMAGPPPGPLAAAQWICLKGNHEDVLLRFLADVDAGPGWCAYGGLDTVRSYLDQPPPGWDRDMAMVQLLLLRHLPPAHRRFFARMPLRFDLGDYVFVHAGVRPGVPLAEQDPEDYLWIRHEFLPDPRWHGKVVVHGHTPVPQPESHPNRIGVDTKAYASGRLTAVVLEGDGRAFLST